MQDRRTYTNASHANEPLSYSDKLRLTNRDALLAVAALAFVVAVWLLCGFGLAGSDMRVFHLPLWVVAGLLGTWAAAIAASLVLARAFKNFDLDDTIDGNGGADSCDGNEAPGAAGPADDGKRVGAGKAPGNPRSAIEGGEAGPFTAHEATHA